MSHGVKYKLNGRTVTAEEFAALPDRTDYSRMGKRTVGVHGDYKREKNSMTLGVLEHEIDETEAECRKHGVDVRFEREGPNTGEAIITSTRQFEKLARLMGQEVR